MDFSKLSLKPHYSSGDMELLSDLWIPLLSNSVLYKRGVGYFRSNYLSSAVNGLIKFIENNGKAMMVCGIEFTEEDIESITNGYKQREKIIEERLLNSVKKMQITKR